MIQITGMLALAVVAVGIVVRYAIRRPNKKRDEVEQRLLEDGDPERFALFPKVYADYRETPEGGDVPNVVIPEAGRLNTIEKYRIQKLIRINWADSK
jgi:hypothetical protein